MDSCLCGFRSSPARSFGRHGGDRGGLRRNGAFAARVGGSIHRKQNRFLARRRIRSCCAKPFRCGGTRGHAAKLTDHEKCKNGRRQNRAPDSQNPPSTRKVSLKKNSI